MTLIESLRAEARRCAAKAASSPSSTYGRGRAGPDPALGRRGRPADARLHRRAASTALRDGETFYTWQRGIPELREALARYHSGISARAFAPDEFIVTGAGMQAIQLALAGDGRRRRRGRSI